MGRRDHRRLLRRGARPHRHRPRGGRREEDDDEEDDDEIGESGHVLRVALSREQAAAFAIHATRLVEAGRPPCPLCSFPLDPSGHDCPRTNGHRPPVT